MEKPGKIAVCILFCGFLIGFFSGAGVNSAQDLLQNSFVPTSTLLSVIGSVFAVFNIISTWFGVRKGSESLKIFLCSFMVFVGTLSSSLVSNIYAKLMFLVFSAVGLAVLDIQYVALASLHHQMGVSSYSAGMGIGVFVGSVFYTGLTTGLCVPFSYVYMISSCLAFFFIILYFLLNPEESQNIVNEGYTLLRQTVGYERHSSVETDYHMERLPTEDKPSTNENELDEELTPPCDEGHEGKEPEVPHSKLSWKVKYEILKQSFIPILLPFAVSTFAEYTSYQSISTTLAFSNSPFQPRDHYQFYTLFFFFGLLLFRAYLFVVMTCCPTWVEKLRIRRIWLISLAQVICTLFLLFSSLYRFLPSVVWVITVVFIHGCLGGMAYVDCLLMASESEEPDFSAALVESGYQVVVVIAAFLGLSFEQILVSHCLEFYESQSELKELCYTRSENISVTSVCG